jgi:hypothetical protein
MTIYKFGIDAASVRAHHFPQQGPFTTDTSPTAVIVAEMVSDAAADLAGLLTAQSISPSGVEALGATDAAYAWCAQTVRLDAAIRVLRASTSADPELAKAWAAQLAARLKSLEALGAAALGSESLQQSATDGPGSHISELSLEVEEGPYEVSQAIHRLRRDDQR